VAGNPRRNALFGVLPETSGLRRLDGGRTRARTWDPMIKSQRDPGTWARPKSIIVKLTRVSFPLVLLTNMGFSDFRRVNIEPTSDRAY
jgi:hypothetical protein